MVRVIFDDDGDLFESLTLPLPFSIMTVSPCCRLSGNSFSLY
jgi:hypothetical protein